MVTVPPGDMRLVDRTGFEKLATTDPVTRTVHVSSVVTPPLLDRVMLHEVAHAVTVSHHLLGGLDRARASRIGSEEWVAGFLEGYGLEAVEAASQVLGRPVCVEGTCHGEP